jgi:hypothetical protein
VRLIVADTGPINYLLLIGSIMGDRDGVVLAGLRVFDGQVSE